METLTAFVRERSRRNEAERTAQDFQQRVSRRAYLLWQEAGRPNGCAEDFWAEAVKQDEFGEPPAADIEAVLTVIKRRSERSLDRESTNGWCLDLRNAILNQAELARMFLDGANFSGANLNGANLGWANLSGADLGGANLMWADFTAADLGNADLNGANLNGANLENAQLAAAVLRWAGLSDANLENAHLEEAVLGEAYLGGTDLGDTTGLAASTRLGV